MMMVNEGKVKTITGGWIDIIAETVCIHGDHQGSAVFAEALSLALKAEGYHIHPKKPRI
jgi:UPF0271 protein